MGKGTMYLVKTAVDPNLLGEIALNIYHDWVEWAIGAKELGNKRLKAPSGKYASGIKLRNKRSNVIEIWIDESKVPYAASLEYGRPEIMLRNAILYGSKSGNAKTSKDGYKYKYVKIGADYDASGALNANMTPTQFSRMSATIHKFNTKEGEWKTVSNRPGTSSWVVPAMSPFAPALILSELLKSQYGVGHGSH